MICLGTGNFGTSTSKQEAFRIMDRYAEFGGMMFDTANVYARWGKEKDNLSEQYIGEWLRERNAKDKIMVATKGGHYDLDMPSVSRVRKECIRKDLEESLLALGLDRIELYWIHKDDRTIPVEEFVDWMEELVKEGLIVRYGASNMKLDRAERARVYAKEKGIAGFYGFQNRFSRAEINPGHPVWKDPGTEIADEAYRMWHAEHQVPLYAYSSMAQGFFSKWKAGRLTDGLKALYLNETNEKTLRLMEKEAKESGLSFGALSLKGIMQEPFPVIPIAAVSHAEQLDELKTIINA